MNGTHADGNRRKSDDRGGRGDCHSRLRRWAASSDLCPDRVLAQALRRPLAGEGPGMTDEAWPADLAPTKPTLKALVERGIIVRRGRAWHLKRDWYRRICCPARSVPCRPRMPRWPSVRARTCPATPRSKGFEQICRWLDAQPKRRARLPFVGPARAARGGERGADRAAAPHAQVPRRPAHLAPASGRSPRPGRTACGHLWDGVDREVREQFPVQPTPSDPVRGGGGHRHVVPQPHRPRRAPLDAAARAGRAAGSKAAEDEEEVDTRWVYDGVPLRMYRAGVSTEQGRRRLLVLHPAQQLARPPHPSGAARGHRGPGAAWARNASGASRRAARLDEVDALIRRMWASPIPFRGEARRNRTRRRAGRSRRSTWRSTSPTPRWPSNRPAATSPARARGRSTRRPSRRSSS